ncbi:MAG: PAS domain S-box protein [Proteobacteria bacterium]|nr:PAS domain S-box protein [Pseudomonadota bacterium]
MATISHSSNASSSELSSDLILSYYRKAIEDQETLLLRLDSRGTILYVNEIFKALFADEFNEADEKIIIETLFSRENEPFQRTEQIIAKINTTIAHELSFEKEVIFKNRRGWVIRWKLMLPKAESDNVGGIIAIGYDITYVRELELQVQFNERRNKKILESCPDAIVVYDMIGQMIYCNQAFTDIFGWTKEELLGKRVPFVPDECIEETMVQVKKLLADEPVVGFHSKRMKKNGEIIEVMLSANVFSIPDEKFNGSVIILRDMTESRALQAQLVHAQKMESIGLLAAGIAHEINTPTQYIGSNIGFLEDAFFSIKAIINSSMEISENAPLDIKEKLEKSLTDNDWDYLSEEISQAIKQSQEGVRRVSRIVGAMKNFSHPGTKDIADNNLNEIIKNTLIVSSNEWKYLANVEKKLNLSLPMISCQADEIGQVVLNLIINAVHAIKQKLGDNTEGKKGLISISTDLGNNDDVIIKVSDNGCGIKKDIIERIFDPFFTTKEVGQGTGQGLAITHDAITHKHGGTIEVESEVGQGATFTISLPRG